jgi:hypothetical protein
VDVAWLGFWNMLRRMVSRFARAACGIAVLLCPFSFCLHLAAQNPGTQQSGPPSLQSAPSGAPGQPSATPSLQLHDLPPDAHTLTPAEQAQLKQQEAVNMALRLASIEARWGPEMSTPGMSISLVEAARTKAADGSTQLTYHITGSGFAAGEMLTLIQWPLDSAAQHVMSGLVLDKTGTAVCGASSTATPAPSAPSLAGSAAAAAPAAPSAPACTKTMQPNQPVVIQATVAEGEPIRVALVGDTEKNGAATTLVPFPIVKEDQGCRLQVILGVKDAAMVLVEGTGFPPNAALKVDSTTSGSTRTLHPKTTPDGRMVFAVLPEAKSQDAGQTTVSFAGLMHFPSLETDKNPPPPDPACKPAVTFSWGKGAYKPE